MNNKKAFITGITGQDGSYLAELLLEKNYEVHAILRRVSLFTTKRINHLFEHPNLHTYHGDLTDSSNLNRSLSKIEPKEIYNLSAQSHVGVSFEVPEYTAEVDAVGALRLLDAIRDTKVNTRFYQASTPELFGGIPGTKPQSEQTPFHPKSPYRAAKLYAYWITVNYRESYELYACNGILFNHESPRQGNTFVTKKITKAVANIYKGKQKVLKIGNLDAKRDWGRAKAKDFVYTQWLMLQQDKLKDYVIATGETHTVREFIELAFEEVGTKIQWKGTGIAEKGMDLSTGKILVEVNKKIFPSSRSKIAFRRCASKAEKELGWKRKISFRELI
jgi:GDPmannose 4,6-dehydratase